MSGSESEEYRTYANPPESFLECKEELPDLYGDGLRTMYETDNDDDEVGETYMWRHAQPVVSDDEYEDLPKPPSPLSVEIPELTRSITMGRTPRHKKERQARPSVADEEEGDESHKALVDSILAKYQDAF
jgi:hypothetical protein